MLDVDQPLQSPNILFIYTVNEMAMAAYTLNSDAGILAQVPGDELSAALRLLPPAAPGLLERMTVDFESPRHGLIRVSFLLNKNPRRTFQNWFWTPCHAELAGDRLAGDARAAE